MIWCYYEQARNWEALLFLPDVACEENAYPNLIKDTGSANAKLQALPQALRNRACAWEHEALWSLTAFAKAPAERQARERKVFPRRGA